MTTNIRDTKSGASVHPQYNILNIMYSLYVQIGGQIEKEAYPSDVKTYIEQHAISREGILSQLKLIADLLDGLLSGKFEREEGTPYIIKAMKDCDWTNRVDWATMTVFDMLASRAMLATWFMAAADLFNEVDIRAQSPGQLTEIVKGACEHAIETGSTLVG